MAAAFICTSLPPLSLRSETKAASSSLSSRRLFAVSPESGGLRIRLSQSPSSLTSIQPRVSRLRRGVVVCEAQETTTDSMLTSLSLFDLVSALLLVVYVEEMCDEHVSLERERAFPCWNLGFLLRWTSSCRFACWNVEESCVLGSLLF